MDNKNVTIKIGDFTIDPRTYATDERIEVTKCPRCGSEHVIYRYAGEIICTDCNAHAKGLTNYLKKLDDNYDFHKSGYITEEGKNV